MVASPTVIAAIVHLSGDQNTSVRQAVTQALLDLQ